MLNNLILTGIAAAFAFVAPPTPDASSPAKQDRVAKQKRGKRAGKRHKKVCKTLECTDAQKAELKELRTEFRADVKPLREKAKALHADLKAERSKDSPNAAVIEGLRAEMKELKTSMKAAKQAHMAAAKEIFTPEQVAQLEQMKAEHKAKRGDKRKRGKGDKARRGNGKRGKGDKARRGNGKRGKGDKARRGNGKRNGDREARRSNRSNRGERGTFASRRARAKG